MSVFAHAGAAAAATVALVSLAVAVAYAQEAPKGATQGPPSTWRFGLNADATWYENAQFVSGPEGSASWSTRGTASLDYARRLSSGAFGIGAFGGTLYYPDVEGLSQPTWGGHLNLSGAPSPGTQLRVGQMYARTNTRQLAFDPAAPPLPTSAVDYATSMLGLTHRLSRSWQLGLDGSFSVHHYAEAQLVDGEELRGSAQLGRQVGRSSSLYVAYGFSNSWFAGTSSRAHQALLGMRYQPTHGLEFAAGAGVAYLETVGQLYPAGNASLSAHGRRAGFTLSYKRDFGQAFGYGRQTVADLGSATLSWSPAARLSFSTGYTYGYRRDPAVNGYQIRGQTASGGFNWGLTKELEVSGRYTWEKNDTEGHAPIEGSRVAAAVSYGVEWR